VADYYRDKGSHKRFAAILRLAAAAVLVALLAAAFPQAAAALEPGEPAPPTGLRELDRPEDAGRRIALTWETRPGDFGYQVYRAERVEGPYEQVGGKAGDSMRDFPVFLDEDAQPGVTYHYRVSCLAQDWEEGPLSDPVEARLEGSFRAAVGAKSIVISLADQRVYFFEGNQLVNIMRCSTGVSPGSTPTGNFRVLGHYRQHGGLGGVTCDYWMSFTSSHGIHAWPRGNSRYESGLGAVASHGCVRLHPAEAYWPFYWAPDGTPIHITYASYARRVVNGCHSTIGGSSASDRWYFAEGYTADDFDTYLLLANPGAAAVTARVDYLLEGGGTVSRDYPLAPLSRFTVPVDAEPGLEHAAFSMQIRAASPIVAERAMYFIYNGKSDGSVTIGGSSASDRWYFAEGYTADDFDTYLLLANPGAAAVTARVDYLLEGGGTVSRDYPLAPLSRFTVPVDAEPGLEHAAFSMQIRAASPIVAERAMYFRKAYTDGGHVSAGAQGLSRDWYFAEGCTRDFYESYVLVGNPGDQDALVDMDFFLPDGSLRYSFAVAPRSRLTVPVQALPGLDYRDMAVSLHSSLPVTAERAQYYSLDSHRGGQATLGSPESSDRWYFAEGYTGDAFDTWLLLSNPGDTEANVIVTFGREGQGSLDYYFAVGPQRRISVHVDELSGLEETSFSMVVWSDRPVVAERAMYFVIPRGY
jgi:hypothetical protein